MITYGPGPDGGRPSSAETGGCVLYHLYCVAWVSLFIGTLGLSADLVGKRLLGPGSGEGYGTYISIAGFLVIMPVGLLLSSVALRAWSRVWVFLLLAVVIAAATALAPAIWR